MLENRPYKFFFVNLHHKNFIFVTFLNDRELLISMFSKTHFGPMSAIVDSIVCRLPIFFFAKKKMFMNQIKQSTHQWKEDISNF